MYLSRCDATVSAFNVYSNYIVSTDSGLYFNTKFIVSGERSVRNMSAQWERSPVRVVALSENCERSVRAEPSDSCERQVSCERPVRAEYPESCERPVRVVSARWELWAPSESPPPVRAAAEVGSNRDSSPLGGSGPENVPHLWLGGQTMVDTWPPQDRGGGGGAGRDGWAGAAGVGRGSRGCQG